MTRHSVKDEVVPRLACPTVSSLLRVYGKKEHGRASRPWHRECGLVLLGLLLFTGCMVKEQLYYAAPTALPNTSREMKSPGFWIGRHPCPDKVILSPSEIEKFNWRIQSELKLTKDITRPAGPKRCGFIVHFADQRLAPTTAGKYKIPGDLDFDDLQNSGLDAGTPVAVTRQSAGWEMGFYGKRVIQRMGGGPADCFLFGERVEGIPSSGGFRGGDESEGGYIFG